VQFRPPECQGGIRVRKGDFIRLHQKGYTQAGRVFLNTRFIENEEAPSFRFGDKRAGTVPGWDQGVLGAPDFSGGIAFVRECST
jgi:hypothetical protein